MSILINPIAPMKLRFSCIAEILIVYSKSVHIRIRIGFGFDPDLIWVVDPDPGKPKFPPKKKK
jgi:hypothetical protein